jgi:hypothetical protein
MENSLWKWQLSCRKTDNKINTIIIFVLFGNSLAYSVISQVPITDEGLSSRFGHMTRSCPIRAETK